MAFLASDSASYITGETIACKWWHVYVSERLALNLLQINYQHRFDKYRGVLIMSTIEERVRKIVVEQLGVKEEELTMMRLL